MYLKLVVELECSTKTSIFRKGQRINTKKSPLNFGTICEGEKEHIEEEWVNIMGESTGQVFFGVWIIGIVLSLQNQIMKITLFAK